MEQIRLITLLEKLGQYTKICVFDNTKDKIELFDGRVKDFPFSCYELLSSFIKMCLIDEETLCIYLMTEEEIKDYFYSMMKED